MNQGDLWSCDHEVPLIFQSYRNHWGWSYWSHFSDSYIRERMQSDKMTCYLRNQRGRSYWTHFSGLYKREDVGNSGISVPVPADQWPLIGSHRQCRESRRCPCLNIMGTWSRGPWFRAPFLSSSSSWTAKALRFWRDQRGRSYRSHRRERIIMVLISGDRWIAFGVYGCQRKFAPTCFSWESVFLSPLIPHGYFSSKHCLNKSSTSFASYTRPSSRSRSESS